MMKRWEWDNQAVELHDDRLTWVEMEGPIRFASGAACDQALDDFLQRGPHVNGVPQDIVREVTEAVREILAKRN